MKILNSLFLVFCSVVCLAQNYPPPEFEKALHEGAEAKITIQVMDVFDNQYPMHPLKLFSLWAVYMEKQFMGRHRVMDKWEGPFVVLGDDAYGIIRIRCQFEKTGILFLRSMANSMVLCALLKTLMKK